MQDRRPNKKTFKHHGNLGDIIYSLPTVIALGGGLLYISHQAGGIDLHEKARGPRPMTLDMIYQMIELLKLQPYLSDVKIYNNETVDVNLNKFREHIIKDRKKEKDHIATWHLDEIGIAYDISSAWLQNITPRYINDIIISHSGRYMSGRHMFPWEALSEYENRCTFIGFESEYRQFKEHTGLLNIVRSPSNTILEFAQYIKGSKLFIGNQSLGFALAEAMKHPRALEVWHKQPNCMPQSSNGHVWLTRALVERYLFSNQKQKKSHGLDKMATLTRNFLFLVGVDMYRRACMARNKLFRGLRVGNGKK